MIRLVPLLLTILALAGPARGQVELQVSVIEGNSLKIVMGPFVDLATGAPATPTSVTYRLDAPVRRGATALLAPVTVTPAGSTLTVYVPASAVRMYSDDVDRQTVELTVTWTSPSGHQGREIARFEILRSRFGPVPTPTP